MQVEIRNYFADTPVTKSEFEAAVDYLKSRGATFHGPTKTWMVPAETIWADVKEGDNIPTQLRTKTIEIFSHANCEREIIWAVKGEA
jgi:hypothetical protein